MRPLLAIAALLLAGLGSAAETATEFGGHTKLRATGQAFPEDSAFREIVGSSALDVLGELRLNLNARSGHWSFDAAWQAVGLHADTLPVTGLPNDDRRYLDLTSVIDESGNSAILHRLDRVWVGYTSEKAVVRLGRQALSWGNGLFYAPMDLVNPFDPAAIDTEYKAGDDMLYLQYLRDSGDDVQAAYVARRNPLTGIAGSEQATTTVKYHGFASFGEYDLLAAQSYGDAVLGIGLGRSIGGAVWSADLVVTDTDLDSYAQLVTNIAYSWVAFGRNMSGAVEYYYNGFGQADSNYDPASLAANPDLQVRLSRGELFALGRHYLAGSIMIEMTPLWTLTPTVFANVGDPSGLFQLVTTYSLGDNATLLGSVNLPLGPNGSEFGGIESGVAGRYLSSDAGIFAQFAFYF
ncbi:MAG: hypothetical protein KJP17_06375 [Gammaproteobacteria bacterium]|nr:hypothetical protein [Gammaproteobacteria bacterium]